MKRANPGTEPGLTIYTTMRSPTATTLALRGCLRVKKQEPSSRKKLKQVCASGRDQASLHLATISVEHSLLILASMGLCLPTAPIIADAVDHATGFSDQRGSAITEPSVNFAMKNLIAKACKRIKRNPASAVDYKYTFHVAP